MQNSTTNEIGNLVLDLFLKDSLEDYLEYLDSMCHGVINNEGYDPDMGRIFEFYRSWKHILNKAHKVHLAQIHPKMKAIVLLR
jgi:hypothetical protein